MRQLILSLSRQPNLPERGDFTCSLLILNSESHLFCVCSIEVNFKSMVIKIQVQGQTSTGIPRRYCGFGSRPSQ